MWFLAFCLLLWLLWPRPRRIVIATDVIPGEMTLLDRHQVPDVFPSLTRWALGTSLQEPSLDLIIEAVSLISGDVVIVGLEGDEIETFRRFYPQAEVL